MSEVQPEGGMTFDQAKAAIESAGEQESQQDAATAAEMQGGEPQTDQAPTPTPGETPEPGATEFASADAGEDSFMGSDFNPDLLPDDLKPGFKQLQAEFTRKTQTLAEQRKALEELGDPDSLKQAQEFYQSLQDPEYLKSFYSELGNVVRELGLVEDPAAPAPAAAEPAVPAEPELSPELRQLVESEPEMAPLAQRLAAMEQELSGFREAQAQERQALEEERQLMSQAAEIDRMVQAVREQHPDYVEQDWQAIYDRAVAYDGNVLQAAEAFEQDKQRIIESWTSQKATPASVTPSPGAGTVTEGTDEEKHMTMDDAQRAAEAYLNANDLQEFTG